MDTIKTSSEFQKNGLILIFIKDQKEAIIIKKKLINKGYEVMLMNTRNEIFELLITREIDLLILDLEIEDTDAISLCQDVRHLKNIHQPYFFVLGERPEDYIQTLVLDSGADNYILKPLKPLLLEARVKALMRRKIKLVENNIIDIKNGVVINTEKHLLYIDSKEFKLPKKEFDILNVLYSNPKKIFTETEIINLIFKNRLTKRNPKIDSYIYRIRKLLGKDLIQIRKGIGYMIG